jgi:hypothetical protein
MVRQLLKLTAMFLFVVAFFNSTILATDEKTDTLVIHQTDQDAMPFNEIIAADTNADGSRKHLVYELDPDGWYPLSGELAAATYDLNIVGGKRTAGQSRPVILVKDPFGGWWMLNAGENVRMEGVHFMQAQETIGGNIGPWARSGLVLNSENKNVVFHDCIWDFTTGFSALMNKNGLNLKVTNCLFRFSKPTDNAVWAGQGLDVSSAQIDTVIIQNCTWYGGGPFMLKTWAATEKLFKMDHCTIVDFVQWPFHGVQWVNSEFTNNVFYNAYTMGEDSAQVKGQDPELLPFGVINIDTLYIDSLGVVDMAKEATRNLLVSNNNNFVKQNIKDYWAVATAPADQIKYHFFRAPDPTFHDGLMNSRSRAMFENDAAWPGLILENTTSLDPQFENYFDYSDTLINYSKYYYKYAWPDAKATKFMLDPDGEPLMPTDPMVYNLKVTNSSLRNASTTGGVIGDLTWELPNGYNSLQSDIATDVKETRLQPDEFALGQNYPNPFNPTTKIEFAVPASGNVSLKVFNVLGQEVTTLINKQMQAGVHQVNFDASKLSSGLYIYKLESGANIITKKMMLLK